MNMPGFTERRILLGIYCGGESYGERFYINPNLRIANLKH